MAQCNQDSGATNRDRITSVLISGAIPAGLAAAWWMHQLGYKVTVDEMAKGFRKDGTPVNTRDGDIDVVRRMNLLERNKSESLPPRPVTFLDARGLPLPLDLSGGRAIGRRVRDREGRAPRDAQREVEDQVRVLLG